ncbi:DUF5689 domain-containing protein [Mesonia sp. K7]|uniref:DUF5689 domain-containing protein n=1 Tax=Mesonia sp. K7 TaxID=2218606 RepID=UPI000DA86552|nr:DUF5689 domain-containing protein [Mesonia sp. K7]PZD78471.1 hypothetical protein DNG35_05255 [Mesonia sp. K7]
MKAINITKILFLVTFTLVFSACVQDDDYDVPNGLGEEQPLPEGAQVISISAVTAQADQSDDGQFTFEETNDFMEGYVISSDEAGNFFRELILQDKPENPTAGIKVMLFVNPLYTSYEVGRKIRINLNGFTVGTSNGVYSLGIPDGNFIDEAPAQFQNKIYRSAEVATIVPLSLTIADFSDDYENIMIQLENMQFTKADFNNNVTYAGESSDEFDGERTIESCATGATTTFSTSTFADFASLPVAAGSGSITGILSRNFEDSKYVVSVNDLSYIEMEDERCDPEVFACEGTSGGAHILFSDDFESYANFAGAEAAGWINVNVANTSGEKWVLGNFNNNNYAQISGFNSGESVITTYLISPEIAMDATTEEELSFDLEVAYSTGVILKVLVTNDYTGDPTTTTWNELDFAIPNEPSNGFGGFDNYTANIECIDGNLRVAFLYEGSDPSATTRYHIDNFEVNGVQ